ncbi:MAG: DUF2652 domain-containing protein [Candidatus Binataceae bacterium]
MLPKPESACFVIADISGYTSFLAGVELDHAQDIIADVMDTMVRCLRPPFRLAKFEGDAAFFYAVTDKVDGSLLQDAIESAYFAFRKRLRNIKQATSCECSACSRIQHLDLKFVGHHGEFIKQRMAGREELAGRDVILIHRLLKNAVNESLGDHAYALCSDSCIPAMGIEPVVQGLVEHRESIDIIGASFTFSVVSAQADIEPTSAGPTIWDRRLAQHNAGTGARSTRGRVCVLLLCRAARDAPRSDEPRVAPET